MQFDDRLSDARFEKEGEEQVRLKLKQEVNTARDLIERDRAAEWLNKKASARETALRDAHLLSQRQAKAAEVANQLGEKQVHLAESANLLAKAATRFSRWALVFSAVGCILALVA